MEQIRDKMPEHEQKMKENAKSEVIETKKTAKTDFTSLKTELLMKMKSVKDNIGLVNDKKETTSNMFENRTKDLIILQQKVRTDLKESNRLFNSLKDMHEKSLKKASKTKDPVIKQESEDNSKLVEQIESQLVRLREKSTFGFKKSTDTATATRAFLFNKNNVTQKENEGESSYVDLTVDETQRLQKIQEQDQSFDKLLEQIELAVEGAGEIAKQIGEEVKSQNKMIDEVGNKVDTVEQKVLSSNEKLKEQLISKTGCGVERFCVSSMCCVVLLGILGVFVAL